MKRLVAAVKSCSPVMELVGFLTWDVFRFLFSDTLSLVTIILGKTNAGY